MQTIEQKQSRTVTFQRISLETIDSKDCFQTRENLDALFSGKFSLEETPTNAKQILFRHLETCRNCCRSFDARLRFLPARRDRIF